MNSRAGLGLVLAGSLFGLGFMAGQLARRQEPAALRIEAGPRLALDLSPKGEAGTVRAPAIRREKQQTPAPVPPELGTQLQTVTATLPALEPGARFHLATFGRIEADRLQLRPVAWLDGPQGARIPFEASTTEAPVSLPLQSRQAPRLSASVFVQVSPARIDPGAMVQRDWGAWRVTAGATRAGAFFGVGILWKL